MNNEEDVKNLDEEIFNNIKFKETGEEDNDNKSSKRGRKKTSFFSKETEIVKETTSDSNELYDEFRSFLEKRIELVPDALENKKTISTGIRLLDAILGGGFAIGALNVIVGQPGSGKTMLAIQTLANGQMQYEGKLLGSFLDAEESTTQVRMSNLGVNRPKIKPYTDMTIEKVFQFLEGMCLFKQEREIVDIPSIVVWDSIANTLSEKEREAEDPKSVVGYKARMLSLLIPQYVAKCSRNNICLLAINQLRDNLQLGQFAPAPDLKFLSHDKEMPGGNAVKFNAFQLVEMKIKSQVKAEKYGFDGIIVRLKCVKNKLFPPNIEIEIVGSFQRGFSDFWTSYNFLENNKRIESVGSWLKLVNYGEKKFRTRECEELYLNDETFRQKFDEILQETINQEIIEKYKEI